jgi:hypothetical protein
MEAKATNQDSETLSEIIRFRVTPQTKLLVQNQANAVHLTMSQYMNQMVQEYDPLKQTVASLKAQATPVDGKSTSTGPKAELLTPERIASIRRLAIKDYQEQHLDKNGGKVPYMELNKQLTDRIKQYETKDLKTLFEKTKGRTALVRDSQGNVIDKVKIDDLPDLVKALLESYKVNPSTRKG